MEGGTTLGVSTLRVFVLWLTLLAVFFAHRKGWFFEAKLILAFSPISCLSVLPMLQKSTTPENIYITLLFSLAFFATPYLFFDPIKEKATLLICSAYHFVIMVVGDFFFSIYVGESIGSCQSISRTPRIYQANTNQCGCILRCYIL